MGKLQSDKDQLATQLLGLDPRLQSTRDRIRELDRDSNRAAQMLMAKEAEIYAS